MKKLFAIVLTVLMVIGLATTALADGTIKNDTDREYHAYQIFTGTQAENNVKLGDVEWGTGIQATDFLTALKASKDFGTTNPFSDCNTAQDVANVLAQEQNKSSLAQTFAHLAEQYLTSVYQEIGAKATKTLNSGYYLLVDQTTVSGDYKAKNPALLQVTNDNSLDIIEKTDVPKVDKTIQEKGEAAEGNIGDTFTFVLTATMPSTFEGYETYKVIFHDTLSKGLTYNNDAQVDVNGFTVTTGSSENGGTEITVTCDNVLAQGVKPNDTITVTYTATLNQDAVIGSAGNPNEVHLEYSNNPSHGSDSTGKTPKDEVIVFTYELDVNKTDEQGTKLANAKFVLLNSDKTKVATVENGKLTGWVDVPNKENQEDWNVKSILTSNENGEFSIAGLNSGTYYLQEIQAPAGYNLLKTPIQVVIKATITNTEDKQSLDKLTITVDNGQEKDGVVSTGVVEMTVKNQSGLTLPETGGMGTTAFYVLGGVLVAAAVVLLVTKRRMKSAE